MPFSGKRARCWKWFSSSSSSFYSSYSFYSFFFGLVFLANQSAPPFADIATKATPTINFFLIEKKTDLKKKMKIRIIIKSNE